MFEQGSFPYLATVASENGGQWNTIHLHQYLWAKTQVDASEQRIPGNNLEWIPTWKPGTVSSTSSRSVAPMVFNVGRRDDGGHRWRTADGLFGPGRNADGCLIAKGLGQFFFVFARVACSQGGTGRHLH